MRKHVAVAVGFVVFMAVIGIIGGWESKYSKLATCTSSHDSIYTFTDNSGNEWEWEREKGEIFTVGNVYRLIMDDNHSSSIHDDWIYKIKKN